MTGKFFKLVLLSIIFVPNFAFGMYDFCESPADYNTFPQAYDVRTEYWKDIPDYHPDNGNIKFENMKNNNPVFPFHLKSKKKKPTSDQIENKN